MFLTARYSNEWLGLPRIFSTARPNHPSPVGGRVGIKISVRDYTETNTLKLDSLVGHNYHLNGNCPYPLVLENIF